MKHATLAARIARVEARQRAKRPLPRLAFRISPEDAPETAIAGYRSLDGFQIARNPGEALSDLLTRAWIEAGDATALFAVYAAGEPPPARDSGCELPKPTPHDPWALAGVGRRATDAELERMGVIAIRPERVL